MRLLAIETSGDPSSVALAENGRLLTERVFPSRMTLCQTLGGHIRDLLAGSSPTSLEALAVSLGPGSFTGLRMGVAMAKAMAHALDLPLVGVSTPEIIAHPLAPPSGATLVVLQHARKTDVYLTAYQRPESGDLVAAAAPEVVAVTGLTSRLRALGTPLLLAGDGAQEHREALASDLGGLATFALADAAMPRAGVLAALADERVAQADPQAHITLRPIYVLASQAERTHGVDLGLK